MFKLEHVIRENIRALHPYSSARDDFDGVAEIFLDANENALGSLGPEGANRYPDPYQRALRGKLAEREELALENVFVGNGSDEVIDLLIRACCTPGSDSIIVQPPTYAVYKIAAEVNDVGVQEILLDESFLPNREALEQCFTPQTKLLFFCSPNNPTGTLIPQETLLSVSKSFSGLVVVDEAYIDFAPGSSVVALVSEIPNLVVMQTMSKAWGLASARIGIAFADKAIVEILDKLKAPYNVSGISQQIALDALSKTESFQSMRECIIAERARFSEALAELELVESVYPSDANFLLVKVANPAAVYDLLLSRGIVVRDRSSLPHLEGCLRITVGTPDENNQVLSVLKESDKL